MASSARHPRSSANIGAYATSCGTELGEAPLPDTEEIYRQALARTMRRAIGRAAELDAERPPIMVAVGH